MTVRDRYVPALRPDDLRFGPSRERSVPTAEAQTRFALLSA
jgi:hypothetical protein